MQVVKSGKRGKGDSCRIHLDFLGFQSQGLVPPITLSASHGCLVGTIGEVWKVISTDLEVLSTYWQHLVGPGARGQSPYTGNHSMLDTALHVVTLKQYANTDGPC